MNWLPRTIYQLLRSYQVTRSYYSLLSSKYPWNFVQYLKVWFDALHHQTARGIQQIGRKNLLGKAQYGELVLQYVFSVEEQGIFPVGKQQEIFN